jgi:hypothetical protein
MDFAQSSEYLEECRIDVDDTSDSNDHGKVLCLRGGLARAVRPCDMEIERRLILTCASGAIPNNEVGKPCSLSPFS